MTGAREARAGIVAGVRAAGPEFAMLAAFVAIGTNLIDIAAAPAPGDPAGLSLVVAIVARILLVFYATYAVQRRMAGIPGPLRPTAAFARFFLFSLVVGILFGLLTSLGARIAADAGLDLAGRWLVMVAVTGVWGILVVKLTAWGAALAAGSGFRALPGVFRRLRGKGVALALAFLQIVLPFAAIHAALMVVGVQLPLSGTGFAALALVDGVVSAAQLLTASALAVYAWRLAERPEALREGGGGR